MPTSVKIRAGAHRRPSCRRRVRCDLGGADARRRACRLRWRSRQPPLSCRPHCRPTLVAAAVVLASMAHGAAARDRVLDAPLALLEWDGARCRDDSSVVVTGRLVSDATAIDSGVRLLIDVRHHRRRPRDPCRRRTYPGICRRRPAAGSIRDWTAGRSIRAPMTFRRPQVWLNPGGPSERWQTLRRPFVLTGSIKSALVVHVTPGPMVGRVGSGGARPRTPTGRQTVSRPGRSHRRRRGRDSDRRSVVAR